jgi:hypothetical protein
VILGLCNIRFDPPPQKKKKKEDYGQSQIELSTITEKKRKKRVVSPEMVTQLGLIHGDDEYITLYIKNFIQKILVYIHDVCGHMFRSYTCISGHMWAFITVLICSEFKAFSSKPVSRIF